MAKNSNDVPTLLGYAELDNFATLTKSYAINRVLTEKTVRKSVCNELEDRFNSARMEHELMMEPIYPMPGYIFKSDYKEGPLKEVTLSKLHLQSLEMPVRERYGSTFPLGILATVTDKSVEFELGNEAVGEFEMSVAAFKRQRRSSISPYFWDVRSEEFNRKFPIARAADGR
jgi:hypothetical protein